MGEWVQQLIAESGYLGIAFLMFLETVFPPIPSEVIMSFAGLEAAKGGFSLIGAIAAGTTGAMFGNVFWYLLAKQIGIHRFDPIVRRFGRWLTVSLGDIEKAHKWFDQHGAAFVLFGRMLPTLRSLISVPAGFMEMNFQRFVIYSTIGTAGWTALLAVAGYKLGQDYAEIEAYVGPVGTAVIVLCVAGYLWRVITWKPHA
jgi:membrane protein DedA with SNARE-associated domain